MLCAALTIAVMTIGVPLGCESPEQRWTDRWYLAVSGLDRFRLDGVAHFNGMRDRHHPSHSIQYRTISGL